MDAHDHMPVQTETVSSYYDQQGNIVKKVTTTVENYDIGTKKIHLDDNTPGNKPKPNKPNKPNKPPSKDKKTKAPMKAVDVSTTMVPSWSSASHDAAPFMPSSTTLVLPSLSNTPGTFPFAPVFSSAFPQVPVTSVSSSPSSSYALVPSTPKKEGVWRIGGPGRPPQWYTRGLRYDPYA